LRGDGQMYVAVGTEQGQVLVLDARGRKHWSFQCAGPIRGSVALADVNDDNEREIIAGCSDGFLYILTHDGRLMHRFDANSPIESTPAVWEDKIIFGCNDGMIYCINVNGDVLWTFASKGKILARPLIARVQEGDRRNVLVGSKDNSLYALDLHGNLEWRYETQGAIMNEPVLTRVGRDREAIIVLGSCDNKVHAVSGRGDRLWTYEADFWVVASPAIVDLDGDGKLEVLAGSYDHNLYILDCEGEYVLEYMPGISGVVHQAGHYAEVLTREAGRQVGKRLFQMRMPGVVIGCSQIRKGAALLATKSGQLVAVGFAEQER
ncbi:MAG: PQQ-like beta-propeller repeat protein, partial [Nitrosarchaeum sp.]|nr:PQQ-like beta-propeller repeat protein [Nitrosarchaeum sp.]